MGSKCCKSEDKIYSDVVRISEQGTQQQQQFFQNNLIDPTTISTTSTSTSKRKSTTMENVPPEFVKPLGDYSFKVNGRGKICVTIQSLSELKVTWFRNGKKLDPSTDPRFHYAVENNIHTLNILQVHVEDEGKWTCVAENQSTTGRQASHGLIKLMIPRAYKPPEFVEPLRAILTDAGTVSLECKVTGVPTPFLQWFKDGEQIKPGDVFALKQADPTSLGSYTCRATNCMGTVVSCSHVHVTSSRPVITDELVDHKARIGEPHVLTVGIRNPVDKVTWYNKGVEVKVDGGRISMNKSDYNVELILKPLMLCDDGEWKCNINGVETSCFVSVVAPKNYRKPRFLQDLKAVLTEEGLVTFECKVVGYPTPELKWFKDGLELKPGDVYQLCGSNSLGQYCCQATNYMGVVESTAELTFDDIQFQLSEEERGKLLEHLSSVNRPPQFVRGLKSATVVVGSKLELNVELNCKAVLEWYFNNQLLTSGENMTITNNSLVDECVAVGRDGEYKCVAKTEYGTSFSCCRISLSIPTTYKKPRFLEGLRAVLHEGIVNLECKVIGVPQPTLKWFKDGVELKAGDIHKIVSSGGNCCLGTYTCQARNCMGSCDSSASLLGFEDNKKEEDALEKLARDPSLSTILEERSSQMISVYETAEGLDEISVSIDGKEVSVSLYETPDLTEQDAKNIIEMFADEYSEFVSEHNVLTLPSLRFVKETTNSGRIVMEAVVIDVDVNGFETAPCRQDSCSEKTEADFEDMSDLSESRHSVLLEDFEAVQVGAAVELVLEKERTMTSLDSPTSINVVLSDGLKMLEIPEKDDYKVVEAENSSSPEVSFYSEGMDTPVFGSLEELPRGTLVGEEDEWEMINKDLMDENAVNNVTVKEFGEQIDEFGGKINEFLNQLNKLTGEGQMVTNQHDYDYDNVQDEDDLDYDGQFHDSTEQLNILDEPQQQLPVFGIAEEEEQIEASTIKTIKERKDSMTQTIAKKTADKSKVKAGDEPESKREPQSPVLAQTTIQNHKNEQDKLLVCDDNEFEMVEHSDVSDYVEDLKIQVANSNVLINEAAKLVQSSKGVDKINQLNQANLVDDLDENFQFAEAEMTSAQINESKLDAILAAQAPSVKSQDGAVKEAKKNQVQELKQGKERLANQSENVSTDILNDDGVVVKPQYQTADANDKESVKSGQTVQILTHPGKKVGDVKQMEGSQLAKENNLVQSSEQINEMTKNGESHVALASTEITKSSKAIKQGDISSLESTQGELAEDIELVGTEKLSSTKANESVQEKTTDEKSKSSQVETNKVSKTEAKDAKDSDARVKNKKADESTLATEQKETLDGDKVNKVDEEKVSSAPSSKSIENEEKQSTVKSKEVSVTESKEQQDAKISKETTGKEKDGNQLLNKNASKQSKEKVEEVKASIQGTKVDEESKMAAFKQLASTSFTEGSVVIATTETDTILSTQEAKDQANENGPKVTWSSDVDENKKLEAAQNNGPTVTWSSDIEERAKLEAAANGPKANWSSDIENADNVKDVSMKTPKANWSSDTQEGTKVEGEKPTDNTPESKSTEEVKGKSNEKVGVSSGESGESLHRGQVVEAQSPQGVEANTLTTGTLNGLETAQQLTENQLLTAKASKAMSINVGKEKELSETVDGVLVNQEMKTEANQVAKSGVEPSLISEQAKTSTTSAEEKPVIASLEKAKTQNGHIEDASQEVIISKTNEQPNSVSGQIAAEKTDDMDKESEDSQENAQIKNHQKKRLSSGQLPPTQHLTGSEVDKSEKAEISQNETSSKNGETTLASKPQQENGVETKEKPESLTKDENVRKPSVVTTEDESLSANLDDLNANILNRNNSKLEKARKSVLMSANELNKSLTEDKSDTVYQEETNKKEKVQDSAQDSKDKNSTTSKEKAAGEVEKSEPSNLEQSTVSKEQEPGAKSSNIETTRKKSISDKQQKSADGTINDSESQLGKEILTGVDKPGSASSEDGKKLDDSKKQNSVHETSVDTDETIRTQNGSVTEVKSKETKPEEDLKEKTTPTEAPSDKQDLVNMKKESEVQSQDTPPERPKRVKKGKSADLTKTLSSDSNPQESEMVDDVKKESNNESPKSKQNEEKAPLTGEVDNTNGESLNKNQAAGTTTATTNEVRPTNVGEENVLDTVDDMSVDSTTKTKDPAATATENVQSPTSNKANTQAAVVGENIGEPAKASTVIETEVQNISKDSESVSKTSIDAKQLELKEAGELTPDWPTKPKQTEQLVTGSNENTANSQSPSSDDLGVNVLDQDTNKREKTKKSVLKSANELKTSVSLDENVAPSQKSEISETNANVDKTGGTSHSSDLSKPEKTADHTENTNDGVSATEKKPLEKSANNNVTGGTAGKDNNVQSTEPQLQDETIEIKEKQDDNKNSKKIINVNLTKLKPGELASFETKLPGYEQVEFQEAEKFDVNAINPTATKVSKIELQSIELVGGNKDSKKSLTEQPQETTAAADGPNETKNAKSSLEEKRQNSCDDGTKIINSTNGTKVPATEDKKLNEKFDKAEQNTKNDTDKKTNVDNEEMKYKAQDEPDTYSNGEADKKEAEKKAKEEAEKKAKDEAHKKAKEESDKKAEEEKKAKEEADKKAKEEADIKAKEEAAKKAKVEAEKKAKEEADKKAEAEKKAKEETGKKAKEEADKKAKEEAEKKPKEEADKKAKVEAEKKAKEEAEQKAKDEADKKAKEEADKKAKVEAEKKAKEEAEKKAKEEADKKAKEEADKKAREEADKKAKVEAEKKAKEEAEQKAKDEADKKAKEEADKKAKEEADKKAKEEADKKAREEADKKAKVEAEKKAKEEAEQKAKDEADKKAKDEADKKAKEEADKKAKVEAEKKAKEEAEKKAKEEADKKAKEEAEKKAKEEADKKAKEEADKKAKEEADKKAKVEAEKKAKEEAEKKAKEEADKKAKVEAEKKAKEEAEQKAKDEAEQKAKDEADKKAKEEAEQKAKDEADKKAKEEADKKAKVEAEKKAKVEAEKKAKEEAEKKAKEEADKKAKEEADKKAKEEADKKAKEEADKKAKVEAEKKAKEEAEKKAKEEADKKAKEEADKKTKEEADKKAKVEAEKKAKEEAEKKAKEEADKKAKEEADKKAKAEAEKKAKEEADKKAKEEADKKAKVEADKKAKDEAEKKAKADADTKAKEEANRIAKEKSDKKAKEEADKKAKFEGEKNAKVEADEKSKNGIDKKGKNDEGKKLKREGSKKAKADQEKVLDEQENVKSDQSEKCVDVKKSVKKETGKITDSSLDARAKVDDKKLVDQPDDNANKKIKDENKVKKPESSQSKVDDKRDSLVEKAGELGSSTKTFDLDSQAILIVEESGDASRFSYKKELDLENESAASRYPSRLLEESKSAIGLGREETRSLNVASSSEVTMTARAGSRIRDSDYENYGSTNRRPDTGFVSGSNNSGVTRNYLSENMSATVESSYGRSSDNKRHAVETLHSKLDMQTTSREKSLGHTGLYGKTNYDDTYGYKRRGDSRLSHVDYVDSLNPYIPRRETRSVTSFDETVFDSKEHLKSFPHEYPHTLKAREYMKSLGYYSAIEEHDHSLAGVDDLPTDNLHGFHGNSRRRPKFTIRLIDRVISSGSTLSINCSAIGLPLPNLEWFRNGFPLIPDARTKVIGGVGFGSIEIRGVEKSDQAEISCVASNSFGRARSSATIHVFDLDRTRTVTPVNFYSHMITENRTKNEIVLETFVKGHEDVRWTKDDKSIDGVGHYSTHNYPDGRCRLTIKNPKGSDSGSWRITASNRFSCNSLSKFISVEEFSLTGFKLPVFIKGLQDLAVEIGDSVFLSVSVEGADTVEFVKSGRLVETKVNRVGCYSTFIPFVQVEDLGVYIAVAKNRHGQVESCCALRAIGGLAAIGPNFVVRPKPVYIVDVGVDLHIVVQVDGEPTPYVNWYKGCRNVTLENPRAYRELLSPGSTRFTLKRITTTDAGLYHFQAKNLSGVEDVQFYVQVRQRARSLTPVSSVTDRRSSLQNRNRHWASVERLARSYRNSAMQSQVYSSLSRERTTVGMVKENNAGTVCIQEVLPGWVSIQWQKVRGRVVGYYVHCKDITDESPQWVELTFTRLCSHETNLRPGRDYIFRITPKCKSNDDLFCLLSDPFYLSHRIVPECTQLLPVSTIGLIGSHYTLQCQLREGGIPCSISWSKDGEVLDSSRTEYKTSFSNRLATLEFIVTENDCGRFCFEAKSQHGRTISYTHFQTTDNEDNVIPCILDNIAKPSIIMEPKNRIVKNGHNAVVSCQVSTICNVEWIFNGKVITDDDNNYKLTSNGKFYSLEINAVNPELTGKYIVNVSNSAGKCSSQFSIHAQDEDWELKPKFLNQSLSDVNVSLGDKFTLHGFVLGTGILFYVWKKDGKLIHRNRYKCYITEHENEHASLTVQKSSYDHSGHYECTVYNQHGQDTIHFKVLVTNPITELKVKKGGSCNNKLAFKKRPEEMELEEGDSTILEFECDGEESDNTQFKWYKDGINVRELKDSQHFTCEHIGSIYRLMVKDAKMQFSGAYKLLIKCGALSINGIVSLQVKCRSTSNNIVSNLIYPLTTRPVITKELEKEVECRYKDRVELRIEFEPNSKIFHVHWGDVNGIVRTGNNFSSLVMPAVDTNQKVSVRIYNSVGSCSSHSNIIISDGAPKFQRRNIPFGGNNKTRTPLTSKKPRFFTHLHDKVVSSTDYDSVTLQVSVKSDYLTRTSWSKDNVELYNSNKFLVREDGDLKTLQITNLNSGDDSGIYTVTIENRFGSQTSNSYLHVT